MCVVSICYKKKTLFAIAKTNFLTACSKEEFMCNNGICIPITQKCDGTRNCQDSSDEINCPSMHIINLFIFYLIRSIYLLIFNLDSFSIVNPIINVNNYIINKKNKLRINNIARNVQKQKHKSGYH